MYEVGNTLLFSIDTKFGVASVSLEIIAVEPVNAISTIYILYGQKRVLYAELQRDVWMVSDPIDIFNVSKISQIRQVSVIKTTRTHTTYCIMKNSTVMSEDNKPLFIGQTIYGIEVFDCKEKAEVAIEQLLEQLGTEPNILFEGKEYPLFEPKEMKVR